MGDLGALWKLVWDTWLLGGIFSSLQFFYGGVRDYGFAIMLLTIVFRVVLFPLTWKQTKSMYELQEIQPKIKALQEKYKNDKEKQQEELMKFYQENKVNPFGGCLPLLAQMPLFIALFDVLRTKLPAYISAMPIAEQAAAKRFWIILPDLTKTPQDIYLAASSGGVLPAILAALPYLVLVILFGLSVWLPQYLMTKDPTQRRTGTYMAVMMLWFGFVSPAGVLVYWVTSSAWQVGQQILTQRVLSAKKAGETPELAAPASKSTKKSGSKKVDDASAAPASKPAAKKTGKKSKGAES
ncbi:MAG: YidC/Oxa1 family membrane protein insertase [Coriobacteriia bacterium]|nr:YidC/Oxa1 family membrane protein insertase [Coriobacteriia bacterium]